MNEQNSIERIQSVIREVGSVIVGKDEILVKVILALLAGGHILMEDIPGVGKTTLAVSLSRALGLDYNRVQFTPDVLPSDITGYSVFDKNTSEMRYQKGAVLCNLFIADELNRATSRTQSALLQAMEEGQVTVDSHTRCCRIPSWIASCCASPWAIPPMKTRSKCCAGSSAASRPPPSGRS